MMAANGSPSSSQSQDTSTRTRQQTSSRMMKTTRRGRPFAKDTHDLFATLIVSLQLGTHRQYFKTYHNSFTTDEAAENLSALKFSQSNRTPDPKEPSRVVTTTTTTTFSMNREMAKGICQHFMDARLIENAADISSPTFKDKGVYMLTPKGLHILERFITKNGINGEHLLKVFSSQPICMKLLHLERRTHDDELLINRPVVEVIFRRFVGRQPNYPTRSTNPGDGRNGNDGDFDRTMGIEMADVSEKVKGQGTKVIKHTFSAVSVLDWLCDFTTICGRDEAAEIAAHFVRLNLISLLSERGKRDENPASVIVRGDDGHGRQTEGEFRCHYKAVYGVTDLGRAVARWEGYRYPETVVMSSRASPVTMSRRSTEDSASAAPPSDDGASQHSERQRVGSVVGATGSDKGSMGQSASQESKLNRRASAAERLRNDYLDTGLYNSRDSNTNRLKQILEEPALRSLFREFLKQNFCEENLSFWLDVQDFKRRFHTTSSAVAVRQPNQASGGGVGGAVRKLGRGQQNVGARSNQFGLTAMEKHQQDLIAMAFVIYNTYLAPASLCELNIEHNLRSELVGYMTKVLSDAKGGPGGLGSAEALASLTSVKSRDSNDTSEERREASGIARAPLHASQLQTMVRLYERIQDHIFRLMATDSVPRFIKDPRFLNLVRSVEEYTEALEAGRVDPRENSGPAIGREVVEAMDLGSERMLPLRAGESGEPGVAK